MKSKPCELSLEELVEAFYVQLECAQPVVSEAINGIAHEFYARLKAMLTGTKFAFLAGKYTNRKSDTELVSYEGNSLILQLLCEDSLGLDFFKRLIYKTKDDSFFHSKLRHLLRYTVFYVRECIPNGPLDYVFLLAESFEKKFGRLHKTSNDVWLADFSFLSVVEHRKQLPAGKERTVQKSLFPKGMLLGMVLPYWSCDAKYFTRENKKSYKARKTDVPYSLRRDIDGGGLIPSRSYSYVVTYNGGLLISDKVTSHAVFRAGQYVMAAGNLGVGANGNIEWLDPESGHMLTGDDNLFCVASWLYKEGFISSKCNIKPHANFLLDEYGQPVYVASISVGDYVDKKAFKTIDQDLFTVLRKQHEIWAWAQAICGPIAEASDQLTPPSELTFWLDTRKIGPSKRLADHQSLQLPEPSAKKLLQNW